LTFSILPFNKGTVLVLADSTVTGNAASDILYIGKTKKLTKRILVGYLGGYGRKETRKINSKLLNDGYLEKVSVSWMLNDNPKVAQQELLEKYKKEHGEYPAWNQSKSISPKSQPTPKVAKAKPAARKPAKPAPQKSSP
jgi:hypothetical protein